MIKRTLIFIVMFVLLLSTPMNTFADEPKKVRVAYDPKMPPYQFEENGEVTGFSVELLNEISKREDLLIEFLPMKQIHAIEKLKENEIDIILNMQFLEEHHQYMEFTDPVVTSSVGLLVKQGNDIIQGVTDLSGSIVSLQRGTLEYQFIRNFRSVKYNVANSQEQAIRLFLTNRSDVFVGDRTFIEHRLKSELEEEQFHFIRSHLIPVEYTMAIGKQNYQLLNQLNRGLRMMKADGTYSQLSNEWFDNDDLMNSLILAIKIVSSLLAVALILFLVGIRWNRQLQKEVKKKTVILTNLNKSLRVQIEKTKNSDQFQKQILDSSPRGITSCTNEGYITSFNRRAKEITNVYHDVIGTHFEKIPLLKELLQGKTEELFTVPKLEYNAQETIVVRDNGQPLHLRYYVYPQRDFQDEITGFILTFEDITEEHKLREQLYEQEKTKALSRVVAGIAHEIRNPLTSIKTFVELIPKKFNNLKFQQEITTYVPKEIERVSALIEGLIDYAKPQKSNVEMIDVKKIIDEVIILFEPTIMSKGFTIKSALDSDAIIEGDQNQIKQIMINLLINSIDAMEENTATDELAITVNTIALQDEVLIEIIDQGNGMTKNELKNVFEPFYTTKAKGTGLGLSTVVQYVRENNGHMTVSSEKGKGTSFQIRFKKAGIKHV